MAKDDTMVMELRLRLDKAEKDLSKFVKKAESSQVKLQGIDHRKFTQPLGKITGSVSEFQKSRFWPKSYIKSLRGKSKKSKM